MIAIVYTSRATVKFNQEALKALLEECRANNRKNKVTGMLLYKNGEFIQVIEGDEQQVTNTFKKIKSDPRHEGVEAILKERITHRLFPFWAMGQCDPNKCEHTRNNALSEIKYDKVTVYSLLQEFKAGLV